MEDDAAGMLGEPLLDVRAAVNVEVVEDEVDHLPGGHFGVQPVEEGDELLPAPTRIDLAQDATGVDFEGGEQAAGAVADVLEGALIEIFEVDEGRSAKLTRRSTGARRILLAC